MYEQFVGYGLKLKNKDRGNISVFLLLAVTDLHEEETGVGGRVVVHVDRQKDGCCHDDHHHDDACQETNLQPLITLSCVVLVSCCTEVKVRLNDTAQSSGSNIMLTINKKLYIITDIKHCR